MEKFIYNFFYKTKGVISVFLVIILVPIVTACSLFVDAGRIKLAHSVVQSAGDLALNSVLTNFDSDLAEIYGFMASAQSTDEAISNAKDYFKKAMVSQGLPEEYSDTYSNALANLLNGGSSDDVINDLLGISLEGDVTIKPVKNGNLTNPELVREQIVEFMKYRAPIEAVSDLWDKFSNMKNNLDDSEEIAKLTDDANDYYEAQGDFAKYMIEAYKNILDFNDLCRENSGFHFSPALNGQKITTIKSFLTDNTTASYRGRYKQYHDMYIRDLAWYVKCGKKSFLTGQSNGIEGQFNKNSASTSDNYAIKINSFPSESELKSLKLGKKAPSNKEYEVNKRISNSYNNDNTNSKGVIEYYKDVVNAQNSLKNLLNQSSFSYTNGTTYNVQYWLRCQKVLADNTGTVTNYTRSLNRLNTALKNLYKYYNALDDKNEKVENLPSLTGSGNYSVNGTSTTYSTYMTQLYNFIKYECYNSNVSGSSLKMFNEITNRLSGISSANIENVKGEYANVNNGVKTIADEINKYVEDLEKGASFLKNAKENITKAVKYYDDMKKAYGTWKTDYEGNNLKTTDAKDNAKEEFNKAKKEMTGKYGIEKSDVKNFQKRVSNAQDLLTNTISAIKSFKYRKGSGNSKSVTDITDFNAFATAAFLSTSNFPANTTDLNKYCNDTFGMELIDNIDALLKATNDNNPDFGVGASKNAYNWVQNQCVDKSGNKIDPRNKDSQEKKQYDHIKNQKEKDSVKDEDETGNDGLSTEEIVDSDSLPSAGSKKDNGSKPSSDIKKMSSNITNLFKDFGGSMIAMRDKLYVLSYITKMFSFDTFQKEIAYENSKPNHKKSEFEDCTLTNIKIDAGNNFSYGNEIEYILYGNKNAENKAASYGTIFAIRYALDLLYAFTNIFPDSKCPELAGFAAAVSAATYGVVPATLVKIVVVLGLTGFEASNDIMILKQGYPLQVIKTDDVWLYKFSVSGLVKGNNVEEANKKADQNGEVCFKYSDYLKLILLMKLIANETPILLRTADVVQANMQKQSGKAFLMKNANVYYQLNAKVKSSELMLALPVVKGTLKDSNVQFESWNKYSIKMYRGY